MPRLLLRLGAGAQAAAVTASVQALPFVQDAVAARVGNTVIVTVDQLTPSVREELASQPGVAGVFDDVQALPQVADPAEQEDFLQRVRALRGEDPPPTIETEPTIRTDGGATTIQPALIDAASAPAAEGPITDIDASRRAAGIDALHAEGLTGEGVIAVVLDTGLAPSSIRDDRQLEGADLTGEDEPWSLLGPHGGMSGGIFAGDATTPGIETGFAPGTAVFPIRSTLAASELIQAQDIIVGLAAESGRPVVVNNSWGFPQCGGLCDHPVTDAISAAAGRSGVHQVFAAGNQAGEVAAGACGAACDGSTPGISGPNSLSGVLAIAATGRDGVPTALQPYSSRGGGGRVACGREKPDLAAPVFGRMPWGASSKNLGNGGGTSAAAPQVAGAVALLVANRNRLASPAARSALTASAARIGETDFDGCAGWGNLRADQAIGAEPVLSSGVSNTTRVAGIGLALGLVGALARGRNAG